MMRMILNFMCWCGRCLSCEMYDTADGIGGKCTNCGKVYGWVTRDELRDYANRHVPP